MRLEIQRWSVSNYHVLLEAQACLSSAPSPGTAFKQQISSMRASALRYATTTVFHGKTTTGCCN